MSCAHLRVLQGLLMCRAKLSAFTLGKTLPPRAAFGIAAPAILGGCKRGELRA